MAVLWYYGGESLCIKKYTPVNNKGGNPSSTSYSQVVQNINKEEIAMMSVPELCVLFLWFLCEFEITLNWKVKKIQTLLYSF